MLKVGDKIIVTKGTLVAVQEGWLGTVKTIVMVDTLDVEGLPYKAYDEDDPYQEWWVDGILLTDLTRELV